MTVLEILKKASYILNLNTEFAPYFDTSSTEEVDETTSNEWDKMKSAFNSLVKKIATESVPLFKEEEIVFDLNGEFLLNNLSQKFHSVQSIVGYSGLLFARQTNDGVLQSKYVGPAVLNYSYVPQDFDTADSFDLFDGVLNDLVFAYGVAYLYCEMSSLYDDADDYKAKFEDELNKCMSSRVRERVIKARRWI